MNTFWDLKIEATNEADARKAISAFEVLTGLNVGSPDVAEYSKIPECYETRFEAAGFSDSPDEAIEELTTLCDKVGSGWLSNSPNKYFDGSLEWSRVIDSRTGEVNIERLFWVHCQFIPVETNMAEQDAAPNP